MKTTFRKRKTTFQDRKTTPRNIYKVKDEYQKRLQSLNKKTTPGKSKKIINKNDKLKKTAPSSDNNQKITAFFSTPPPPPKKITKITLTPGTEDSGPLETDNSADNNESMKINDNDMMNMKTTNIMKKTFDNISTTERIKNYNRLTTGDDCVYGSGRCGTHHCKLVRSVKQKRMSVASKDGVISWVMRDVTCLMCPSKDQTKPLTSVNSARPDTPDPSELNQGPNKKPRIPGSEENEPISTHEYQSHGE